MNKLEGMGGVVLFVYLLDLFVISLMAFHNVEVLCLFQQVYQRMPELNALRFHTLSLLFTIVNLFFFFFPFSRRSRIDIAKITPLVSHGGSFRCFAVFLLSGACLSMMGMKCLTMLTIIGVIKVINNAKRSTAYVKKKNICVKPFKCSILNDGVTFGYTPWQIRGPCVKDRVEVTDANVRYRSIMNRVLAVSI